MSSSECDCVKNYLNECTTHPTPSTTIWATAKITLPEVYSGIWTFKALCIDTLVELGENYAEISQQAAEVLGEEFSMSDPLVITFSFKYEETLKPAGGSRIAAAAVVASVKEMVARAGGGKRGRKDKTRWMCPDCDEIIKKGTLFNVGLHYIKDHDYRLY